MYPFIPGKLLPERPYIEQAFVTQQTRKKKTSQSGEIHYECIQGCLSNLDSHKVTSDLLAKHSSQGCAGDDIQIILTTCLVWGKAHLVQLTFKKWTRGHANKGRLHHQRQTEAENVTVSYWHLLLVTFSSHLRSSSHCSLSFNTEYLWDVMCGNTRVEQCMRTENPFKQGQAWKHVNTSWFKLESDVHSGLKSNICGGKKSSKI